MSTIQDFINTTRFLLQDMTAGAYRYTDETLVMGLNIAFDEAYRIRPDIFVRQSEQVLIGAPLTLEVTFPRGYYMAFVYYMAGFAQMSDQEDTTDARAGIFLSKFVAQMTTTQS